MTSETGARSHHIIVIGAGVGGLGTALAMSRAGHRVTIIERDATPLPPDPDAAFLWDRRGAPQVRHSHALLARLRNLLRDRFPDVLDRLLDAGATEMRFADMLPEGIDDPSPVAGDDDLVALACRRTTFEWVLRRVVIDDPHVELIDGSVTHGLVFAPPDGGPAQVRGVQITRTGNDAIEELAADLVVAATGRRSGSIRWLAEAGLDLEVEEEDTGIVYFSRFYRLLPDAVPPPQDGPIGGDLGYLKYAVFQGDNRTFSVTFAIRTKDDELRAKLLDPDVFDAAAGALPATKAWADPALAEPITEVHVMAGLLNRRIRFTDDAGNPLVVGFHAVGDAHTCTNPLYGRGCSLSMVQATLLTDALAAHAPADPALGQSYEAASKREIEPWYQAALQQDRMARDLAAKEREPHDAPLDGHEDAPLDAPLDRNGDGYADPQQFMRDFLLEGVMPAVRLHASVFRAFVRMFNLLDPPEALFANADVLAKVMSVYQDRGSREPDAPLGPPRRTMLALLDGEAA